MVVGHLAGARGRDVGGPVRHAAHGAVGADAENELVVEIRIEVHSQLCKHGPGELVGFGRGARVEMNGFPDGPDGISIGRTVGIDLLVERNDLLVERLEHQRHFGRRDQQVLGDVDSHLTVLGVVALSVDVTDFMQNRSADREHGCGFGQDGFLCHERTSSFACLFGPIPPKARLP